MILGTILVLLSWTLLTVVTGILGLSLLIRLGSKSTKRTVTPHLARASLWWGLLILIMAVLAINILQPLASGLSAVIFLIFFAIALIVFTVQRPKIQWLTIPRSPQIALITAVLFIAWVFLAFAALGPVTNYDTGLYHLGAIRYASEFSTIPGLANLFSPFGYNTSLYPFAAFLGNGPWGSEGFRLANGLIITILICDLLVRICATRGQFRRLSVGSWILFVAVLIALVPLVALSDYWVTSPSSDAPVMLLTFVSCAYLADGLWKRKGSLDLATSFVVGVILFSLRPTMTFFLIGILIVISVSVVKHRADVNRRVHVALLALAGILGLALLAIQTIRDYFLSGWVQFPLSIYSFDTPWTSIESEELRMATLGNARNSEDIWGSVEGFAWVIPWIRRLPDQWEPFLIIALAFALIILTLTARMQSIHIRIRLMLLLMVPSAITTVVWFFFAPPSFRFGWGPIFSLFIIPIGVLIHGLMKAKKTDSRIQFISPALIGILVVGLFFVTVYTATVRLPNLLAPVAQQFKLGSLQIQYQATPVITVPVELRELSSGLIVEKPIQSDQCWNNYPLCTPIVFESVTLRDGDIQKGFLP